MANKPNKPKTAEEADAQRGKFLSSLGLTKAQAGAKVAKLGIDIYTSAEAVKARQQEDMRNAAIATQQRSVSFNRDTQAFLKNQQDLKDQNTSDNLNISLAQAQAMDELAMSTAGSGLAGASVDELGDEITREVGRDRVAAHRAFKSASDAARINLKQENENRVFEAENAYVNRNTSDELGGAVLSAVGSALVI